MEMKWLISMTDKPSPGPGNESLNYYRTSVSLSPLSRGKSSLLSAPSAQYLHPWKLPPCFMIRGRNRFSGHFKIMRKQWHRNEGGTMELDVHKDQKKGRRKQEHSNVRYFRMRYWNSETPIQPFSRRFYSSSSKCSLRRKSNNRIHQFTRQK